MKLMIPESRFAGIGVTDEVMKKVELEIAKATLAHVAKQVEEFMMGDCDSVPHEGHLCCRCNCRDCRDELLAALKEAWE